MMLQRISALIMLAGASCACSTVERPAPVDTSCLALKALNFAQLPLGQKDDPGNLADSDQTVDQIIEHNARWYALCPRAVR